MTKLTNIWLRLYRHSSSAHKILQAWISLIILAKFQCYLIEKKACLILLIINHGHDNDWRNILLISNFLLFIKVKNFIKLEDDFKSSQTIKQKFQNQEHHKISLFPFSKLFNRLLFNLFSRFLVFCIIPFQRWKFLFPTRNNSCTQKNYLSYMELRRRQEQIHSTKKLWGWKKSFLGAKSLFYWSFLLCSLFLDFSYSQMLNYIKLSSVDEQWF